MASVARTHNDANVLVLGGDLLTPDAAMQVLDAWLGGRFAGLERYRRRLDKVRRLERGGNASLTVEDADPEVAAALRAEEQREADTLNLIASENYASRAVREAQASVMTNKYAEGYPGRRWYNGCEFVDRVEQLAIERARRLFGADHANVQPHCGSAANMAVYLAVLQPGDSILAMSLAHGGHLTHGHKLNFSGRFFNVVPYGVRRDSEQIDYAEVAALAQTCRPRLIVAGASAYPRILDFGALREIADRCGAALMVDMAHIAGLVAGACHPNPVPLAEFVTTTTHKTLRGPRSGMVLCRHPFAQDVDRQVFPGIQGGPLMHVIAAKAVCFREAMRPEFRDYQRQVVRNAQVLAERLAAGGLRIVSGGTDNHLMLVDLTPINVTGRDAATALERAAITVNKNAIPYDPRSPMVTSGIRIGTPAVTTRGMKEAHMERIADWIVAVVRHTDDERVIRETREQAVALAREFPVP
jgi:glycine hydroxymethyltransferase